MRRSIFTILAALSLALCLVVVALWVRSYWFYDHWVLEAWRGPDPHYTALQLCQGSFRGILTDADGCRRAGEPRAWQFAGFGVKWADVFMWNKARHGPANGPMDPWNVAEETFDHSKQSPPGIFIRIPCWFPALGFACLPAWWLIAARLRRRIFTTLAAVSLLTCLAVVVLWVRSYWFYDHWVLEAWDNNGHYTAVQVCQGSIRGISSDANRWPERFWEFAGFGVRWSDVLIWDSEHGPIHGRMDSWDVSERLGDSLQPAPGFIVRIPCWFPALGFACLPAWWLIAALWRRRGRRAGLCPACGYDLRVSKDACPECGRAIPAKAGPA